MNPILHSRMKKRATQSQPLMLTFTEERLTEYVEYLRPNPPTLGSEENLWDVGLELDDDYDA